MSVINQNLLLTPEGYQISRSVRLRSSASAYFSKTLVTPTNNKIFTLSCWIKRGALGSTYSYPNLFGTSSDEILFYSATYTDELAVNFAAGAQCNVVVSQVFRDPSAWYHIVIAVDTTQATAANRVKIYVNGVQVTSFATASYPSLNYNPSFNSAVAHNLGGNSSSSRYFDGYLTEVNFIDGQALTPSSFGETDSVTGVWKPKKYAGTYGTNGFYLNFSDNSAATAAAIGKDYSGNGNNWTPNNISVTAGATYDSMVDVPTMYADGGNGRGNYCVVNPLKKSSSATITDGNLTVAISGVGGEQPASFAMSSGKWYWEVSPNATYSAPGILLTSKTPSASSIANDYHYYGNNGLFYTNTSGVAYGATFGNGDVIGVALDLDSNQITFYKNNTSQGTKTIAAGEYYPDLAGATTVTNYANFGQRPFAYTPPTGFKALNTQNLPDATIKNGNQYFDVTLYSGTSANQTVLNSGSMNPDFVWIKTRNGTYPPVLMNSTTGAAQFLMSNSTNAEATFATGLTSFNSNGFGLGADTTSGAWNYTGQNYVAWQWKESASAGFDIVTYTGNGSTQAVNHSLGVAPSMVIVKGRSGTGRNWMVQFGKTNADRYLMLNSTAAYTIDSTPWNTTNPTSTTFTVGANANTNQSSETFVAYLFAEVAGYSAFGSYTGNGSADGPFVYLGFRPRFVLVKSTGSEYWYMIDTARDVDNPQNEYLLANASSAEATYTSLFDFNANGFKIRGAAAANNSNAVTYIYAAFAENPFKNSLAR